MTSTQLLTRALNVPILAFEPEEIPGGGYCQITGDPIARGYRCLDKRIVPAALSDIGGFFNGDPHGWMSESAARMFAGKIPIGGEGKRAATLAAPDWNLGSRLVLARDGRIVMHRHLLISRKQAVEKGRPYWSETVREIWPAYADCECLVILTTDVKKRTWNAAMPGMLGSRTPILIHATEYNVDRRIIWVDWPKLIAVLDVIESILAHGFTYEAVRIGLVRDHKIAVRLGWSATRALDNQLVPLRTTPEFLPALIMSQRPEAAEPEVATIGEPIEDATEFQPSLFTEQP